MLGQVEAAHARDALTAASEMVLFVERYRPEREGLVGTVGKLSVQPGAINVIPQDVGFTIDVRSGDDTLRRETVAALQTEFDAIAKRRNAAVNAAPFYAANAAPCDGAMKEAFADAIQSHGIAVRGCRAAQVTTRWNFPRWRPRRCCSRAAATTASATSPTRR